MSLTRSRGQGLLGRGALVGVLVGMVSLLPHHNSASATAASSLPLTTSGVHLGMEFNYKEPTVNGYKTQEGNVNYVFGADGGMRNVPANPGGAFHDKYLSWSRDAASGASEPISWYKTYHPDWLLYKSDRTTIPIAMGDNVAPLDFTNPAVQQYIVSHWINPALAGGFQGVSFDNALGFNYLGAVGHYTIGGTWVPMYTGNWIDTTWATAQVTAFRTIAAAVHATYPAATVGLNEGMDCNDDATLSQAGEQYADIVTDQAGFTNAANNSLPYVAQYANQFCPNGKWITVAQWAEHLGRDLGAGLFLVNPEPYAVTTDMTDSNSLARFDLQWTLANYLLVKYAHTYLWWGAWADQAGYPLVMQREETSVQAIGSPTDDFYGSQSVYMRDFSNGRAVVNPDRYNAHTVSFPAGTYKDLYGNPITTVSMPAHSGIVLLRTSSSPAPTPTPTSTPTGSPPPSSGAATIAVEGSNQGLWAKHGSGSWLNLGGTLSAAPAVVKLPSGTDLYIVAGSNHTIWERTDSTGWQELSSFACQSNPGATVSGSTLSVACRGSNNALWEASVGIPSSGLPSLPSFASLGGTTYYGPAVSAVNGTPTYFVTGTDNRIWWRTSGGNWQAISSGCASSPAASSYGSTSYLACRGSAGAPWYSKNTGSGWSLFAGAGGTEVSGPGVAATSSGALLVIETSNNSDLQNQLGSGGSLSGWQGTGGASLNGASAG